MKQESLLKGEGDRYLIGGIQSGDSGAFRQLVDRYSGRLTAYASRRLSGTGLDAEDAVQETFLGFLQSIDRLQDVRSLEAYLFRILQNKLVDLTGKRPEAHGLHRVPLLREDSQGGIEGYDPVARGGSPSSYARQGEAMQVRDRVLADILEEAISALKDEKNFRDLKILELLLFCSWRNREIAALVGVSEPTVTRTKVAALEKLSRLAARHPLFKESFTLPEAEESSSELLKAAWRENLLSCVKRSTLGAYALGALEKEWQDYIAFHLDIAGCETCAANLADLKSQGGVATPAARERVFASSVGFLRKVGPRK
jgi:RNA polymerase sigma-70 factor (ECF subfamily)